MSATEDRLRTLMLRGLGGEAAAHGLLLVELSVLLRRFYAKRWSGDPGDVEDLVQETLIAVHVRRESYDIDKPFTAWAFAMARYKLVDEFRRRGSSTTVSLDDVDELLSADGSESVAAAMDIDRLLSELSAQQRLAIQQVRLEGLTTEEAAERSGLTRTNVKVSVHRGLKKLWRLVQKGSARAN